MAARCGLALLAFAAASSPAVASAVDGGLVGGLPSESAAAPPEAPPAALRPARPSRRLAAAVQAVNISGAATSLCGDFVNPCRKVAHVPTGPDIWISSSFSYRSDGSYIHEELGYFNETACSKGKPWLQIKYEGRWRSEDAQGVGVPDTVSSVAVDVVSVWLTLAEDEVCARAIEGEVQCMKTNETIRAVCPCNGWDWSTVDGAPRKRNVGMFCMPRQQCPVLHEAFLHQTHHVYFKADAYRACLSPTSTSASRTYEPSEEQCVQKVTPALCFTSVSSAPPGARPRPGAAVALALAAVSAAAAAVAGR